jgi:hypothetical protein
MLLKKFNSLRLGPLRLTRKTFHNRYELILLTAFFSECIDFNTVFLYFNP